MIRILLACADCNGEGCVPDPDGADEYVICETCEGTGEVEDNGEDDAYDRARQDELDDRPR